MRLILSKSTDDGESALHLAAQVSHPVVASKILGMQLYTMLIVRTLNIAIKNGNKDIALV